MKQLSLFSQTKTLARSGAEGVVYVKDVDLYYGDTSGAEIRLTAAGQPVNGGTVTIVTGGGSYASPTSTEGDVIVRGSSADVALAIGNDGEVLTVDTGIAGKVKWAAAGGGAITAISSTTGIDVSGNRGNLYWLRVTGEPDRLIAVGQKADGSTYEWRELLVFGP